MLHAQGPVGGAFSPFLNGVSLRQPEAAHCAAAGGALAELHRAGSDFALRRRQCAVGLRAGASWPTPPMPAPMRSERNLGGLIGEALADLAPSTGPRDLPAG